MAFDLSYLNDLPASFFKYIIETTPTFAQAVSPTLVEETKVAKTKGKVCQGQEIQNLVAQLRAEKQEYERIAKDRYEKLEAESKKEAEGCGKAMQEKETLNKSLTHTLNQTLEDAKACESSKIRDVKACEDANAGQSRACEDAKNAQIAACEHAKNEEAKKGFAAGMEAGRAAGIKESGALPKISEQSPAELVLKSEIQELKSKILDLENTVNSQKNELNKRDEALKNEGEKYEALKSAQEFMGGTITSLEKENKLLRPRPEQIVVDNLRTALTDCQDASGKYSLKISELKQLNDELENSKTSELATVNENLTRQTREWNEKKEGLEKALAAESAETKKARESQTASETKVAHLEGEKGQLLAQISSLNQQIKTFSTEIDDLRLRPERKDVESLQKKIDEFQKAMENSAKLLTDCNALTEELKKENDELKSQTSGVLAQSEGRDQTIIDLQNKLHAMNSQLLQSKGSKAGLMKSNEELKGEVRTLAGVNESLRQQIILLEKRPEEGKVEELKTAISTHQQEAQTFEARLNELTGQLSASKQNLENATSNWEKEKTAQNVLMENLKEQNTLCQTNLQEKDKKLVEVEANLLLSSATNSKLNESNKLLNDEKIKLTSDIKGLREEVSVLEKRPEESKVKALEDQLTTWQQELEASQKTVKELENTLNISTQSLQDAQRKWAEEKETLTAARTKAIDACNTLSASERENLLKIKTLEASKLRLREGRDKKHQELLKLSQEKTKCETDVKTLGDANTKLTANVLNLKTSVEAKEAAYKLLQKENQTLRDANTGLTTDVSDLTTNLKAKEAAHKLVEEKHKDKMTATSGLLLQAEQIFKAVLRDVKIPERETGKEESFKLYLNALETFVTQNKITLNLVMDQWETSLFGRSIAENISKLFCSPAAKRLKSLEEATQTLWTLMTDYSSLVKKIGAQFALATENVDLKSKTCEEIKSKALILKDYNDNLVTMIGLERDFVKKVTEIVDANKPQITKEEKKKALSPSTKETILILILSDILSEVQKQLVVVLEEGKKAKLCLALIAQIWQTSLQEQKEPSGEQLLTGKEKTEAEKPEANCVSNQTVVNLLKQTKYLVKTEKECRTSIATTLTLVREFTGEKELKSSEGVKQVLEKWQQNFVRCVMRYSFFGKGQVPIAVETLKETFQKSKSLKVLVPPVTFLSLYKNVKGGMLTSSLDTTSDQKFKDAFFEQARKATDALEKDIASILVKLTENCSEAELKAKVENYTKLVNQLICSMKVWDLFDYEEKLVAEHRKLEVALEELGKVDAERVSSWRTLYRQLIPLCQPTLAAILLAKELKSPEEGKLCNTLAVKITAASVSGVVSHGTILSLLIVGLGFEKIYPSLLLSSEKILAALRKATGLLSSDKYKNIVPKARERGAAWTNIVEEFFDDIGFPLKSL